MNEEQFIKAGQDMKYFDHFYLAMQYTNFASNTNQEIENIFTKCILGMCQEDIRFIKNHSTKLYNIIINHIVWPKKEAELIIKGIIE